MRIANTLLLGAAALICASAPLLAQGNTTGANTDGFKPVPAVAPLPGKAAPKPAALAPASQAAAPAPHDPEDTNRAPTTDAAPPTTEAAAAPAATPQPAAPKTAVTEPKAVAVPAKAADAKPDAKPEAAVQEASNHAPGATQIDATDAINPDDHDSIAATVNDESISDYELRQRVALYMATSGLLNQKLTDEQTKRIRSQQLDLLESEKVQLQEAVKKKITVSPTEVDKRINMMMSENRFDINQLRTTLAAAGASEDALRAQLTAAIAWMKTVQDEYGEKVNVTPEMVNAELAKYAEGANKVHYRVVEIFLPVENADQDAKVKKDAEEIEKQLHQGAPFPIVARQFSQHPTAATGGDIGWVYDGQLAPELNHALKTMEQGDVTPPIRSTGGYYILGLRDRQEPVGTKVAEAPTGPVGPSASLPLARLLFPVNPRGPKDEIEEIMKVATQIQTHYSGCSQLEELHKKMTGTVYMNLGNIQLDGLSPQIQQAMAQTKPGEAGAPFTSDAGIELIGRCDKRIVERTAYVMPTRDDVENQLFQQQISAYARRYLRDLKRNANIQVRDDSKPDALIR